MTTVPQMTPPDTFVHQHALVQWPQNLQRRGEGATFDRGQDVGAKLRLYFQERRLRWKNRKKIKKNSAVHVLDFVGLRRHA